MGRENQAKYEVYKRTRSCFQGRGYPAGTEVHKFEELLPRPGLLGPESPWFGGLLTKNGVFPSQLHTWSSLLHALRAFSVHAQQYHLANSQQGSPSTPLRTWQGACGWNPSLANVCHILTIGTATGAATTDATTHHTWDPSHWLTRGVGWTATPRRQAPGPVTSVAWFRSWFGICWAWGWGLGFCNVTAHMLCTPHPGRTVAGCQIQK